MSESYEVARGLRCISYTKRAANPVIASDCQLIPEQWLSYSPVLISLALSLALASSGFAILLEINSLGMAEGVGFEPTVALRLRLISSQVPSTTQPPFLPFNCNNLRRIWTSRSDNCILQPDTGRLPKHSTPPEPDMDPLWQKTPSADLVRYVPSHNYFARVRVAGKLIRRSLKPRVRSVAKLNLADFENGGRARSDSPRTRRIKLVASAQRLWADGDWFFDLRSNLGGFARPATESDCRSRIVS